MGAISWCVIPSNEDIIFYEGKGCKNRALKKARELYLMGDLNVFVQKIDDNDPDGFCANGEIIRGLDLMGVLK